MPSAARPSSAAALFTAHGKPPGRRALRLALLALTVALLLAGPAAGEDPENCLFCHRFPGLSRYDAEQHRVHIFFIDPAYMHGAHGPHARLACTDCHSREQVSVVPHREVTPVDCTRQCHLVQAGRPPRRFSHRDVALTLERSVHRPEVLAGLEFSGGPLLATGQSVCLYCHDEPLFRDAPEFEKLIARSDSRSLERCDGCHSTQVPLDTHYFLRHIASRLSPGPPSLEVAQRCGVCHSDPAVLAQRQMNDAVASYVRSFHGKAALLGDQSTAHCLSCHVSAGSDPHELLGPENPRSSVNAEHVANACRSTACHPGADMRISQAAVHLDLAAARGTVEFVIALAFIILTAGVFLPSVLLVLLELAQIVVARPHPQAGPLHHLIAKIMDHPEGPRRLARFTVPQRIQHWILAVLFVLLALTGFPMKFADQLWSAWVIETFFGTLGVARIVHHWAGLALIAGLLLHLAAVLGSLGRRALKPTPDGRRVGFRAALRTMPMLPGREDLSRAGALLAYLLGLRRERPLFGRFTVAEKLDYVGVIWGTFVLGVTGLILWGEQFASHLFGGRVFSIATIFHTYEAFLAIIHVGILHMYNVIFSPVVFPLSLATLSGSTPAAKLAEENGEFVLQVARDLGIPEAVGTESGRGMPHG